MKIYQRWRERKDKEVAEQMERKKKKGEFVKIFKRPSQEQDQRGFGKLGGLERPAAKPEPTGGATNRLAKNQNAGEEEERRRVPGWRRGLVQTHVGAGNKEQSAGANHKGNELGGKINQRPAAREVNTVNGRKADSRKNTGDNDKRPVIVAKGGKCRGETRHIGELETRNWKFGIGDYWVRSGANINP